MRDSYVKPSRLVIAAAALLAGVAVPESSRTCTQSGASCATQAPNPSCMLVGMRIVPNRSNPTQVMLQIATKQGTYSFIATRPALEQLAKDLLRNVEGSDKQKI